MLFIHYQVTVPEMSPANLPVPDVLRQYTEREIQNWVAVRFAAMMENGQTEIAIRPFCRWLDRNMETIFTEGNTHISNHKVKAFYFNLRINHS